MTSRDFTYALLRYVPDPERMEPMNFGVVVQSSEGMRIKLDNYFGARKGIEASVYKRWREFLEEEVEGEQKSIFRPSRESPEFWRYLRSLTGDTVLMTAPLKMSTGDDIDLTAALDGLYERLVSRRTAEKDSSPGKPGNPTFEFRRIRDEKKLDRRGLMKGHGVRGKDGEVLWTPYRAIENGRRVAINKVEVNNDPERTNTEIGTAKYVASIGAQLKRLGIIWVVLFDALNERLPGQDAEAFNDMKDALESSRKRVNEANGTILSNPEEVRQFVDDLETSLQPN